MKKEQPKDNKAIRESQRYYSNQHDQCEENLRQGWHKNYKHQYRHAYNEYQEEWN